MSNFLDDSTVWLAGVIETAAGRSVVYVQGQLRFNIVAVPLRREYEVAGDEGFTTQIVSWDWSIKSAGLEFTPRRGDMIEEPHSDPEKTPTQYEVLPMGKRPCFEDADFGASVVIHSKLIPRA